MTPARIQTFWFGKEQNPRLTRYVTVDFPGPFLCHNRFLHDPNIGEKAQETHLGNPAKGSLAGLVAIQPLFSHTVMNVRRVSECQPNVDVR